MQGPKVLVCGFALLAAAGGGCTSARSNARLTPGLSGGLTGVGLCMPPGRNDFHPAKPETTNTIYMPLAEGAAQYAWVSPRGTGFALQLKVPALYPLASLDIYGQFGNDERWSHGGGFELGFAPAAYYVVTRHSGPEYASFTARALTPLGSGNLIVTPQLAVGVQGRVDFFGFANYFRPLQREVDIASESDTHRDRRSQWLLVGLGVRL